MIQSLYNILILPIEYIMEMVFMVIYHFFDNLYAAIVGLSLFVSLSTLPLFNAAEAISQKAKNKKNSLKDMTAHIKRSFKGDERTMILTAYYRLNDYSQIADLKTLLPLLLQIPFFIAAYRFLAEFDLLKEGFLGSSDGLISLWGRRINLFPILMTSINLVSSFIYTKEGTGSERISTVISALLFFVILYDCPSALLIYWILNNAFSLMKNVMKKLISDKAKTVRRIIKFSVAAFYIWFVLSARVLSFILTERYDRLLLGLLPVLVLFFLKKTKPEDKAEISERLRCYLNDGMIMLLPMALMVGIYIPLKVLEASPMEFVNVFCYSTPFIFVMDNAESVAGILLVWLPVMVVASKKKTEKTGAIISAIFFSGMVSFFAFGGNRLVDSMITFDDKLNYGLPQYIFNLILLILVFLIVYSLYKYYKRYIRVIAMTMTISIMVAGIYSAALIQREITHEKEKAEKYIPDEEAFIPMSKNGKNVVVIVLDRAIGRYVPYIFQERPELKSQFEGFTWYPNTISYSYYTVMASPALYGGYEYTPEKINSRSDEKLENKVNESMLMFGRLFAEEEYDVTMIDPPYPGMKEVHDLSVYDEYEDITAYQLWQRYKDTNDTESRNKRRKNLFLYAFYEVLPRITGELLYNDGRMAVANAKWNYYSYIDSMEELKRLPEFICIENEKDCFFSMHNLLTHSPTALSRQDYYTTVDDAKEQYPEEGITIDGVKMKLETESQVRHFQVNVAAFMWLGKWLEWLKENDIYDNTRIIIVSDHGYPLDQFDDMMLEDGCDREAYNPLLLVKDFDEREFGVSGDFMTNADTIGLAIRDIKEKAVNPFTGEVMDDDEKKEVQMITSSGHVNVEDHGEYKYNTEDGVWYAVDGDLFDNSKWRCVEDDR